MLTRAALGHRRRRRRETRFLRRRRRSRAQGRWWSYLQVLPRRSGMLLSFEQTPLPADAPSIAGDGPVFLDDPVTWDEDRDGVRTNCLRDVAGIARSELGRHCPVTRRLCARDFAQHGPDMLLVVAAAHVEHDFRILSGVIDDAFELGDSAG